VSADQNDLTIPKNRIYLSQTTEKYNICISIVIVNGVGTGKRCQELKGDNP